MHFSVPYRKGTPQELADEFLSIAGNRLINLETEEFTDPAVFNADNVMAVHFSHSGAQGECGAVNILYNSPEGIRVLHGNYAYGGLDCDALVQQLPVLRVFAYSVIPVLRATKLPDDWRYVYMGALNYFIYHQQVCDETNDFITHLMKNGGYDWQIFNAVAWFYGAQYRNEPRQFE